MGSKISGSHCRLRKPSNTFMNFYRWIHISNQEYRVLHPRGYLSLLAIPNTRIFHFILLLCDHETHFGRCPILPSPPSNTKHGVDLPCTHDIPLNTEHIFDHYHVLTTYHRTPNTMSISTMHSHPCHAMFRA